MAEPQAARHRAALAGLLGSDAVRWDAESLAQHSHDYWFLNVLREQRGRLSNAPLCVVCPTSAEQVRSVLRYANQQRLPIVPYGAGSGVCGGVQPDALSVVVDMRRMDRILELNEKALTVRVQAGKMGNAFESELNAAGYSARHFPQSIDVSTVGGWVSTRAAGQHSTRYGNIEDLLVAFEAALPDGRIISTHVGPRSATGPDLRHFFLGAEGTMGVLTEITLRIVPLPESSAGQAFSFASMHDGLEAIRLFMRAGWRPPVVRLYDATETARLFTAVSQGDNCLLLLLSEGPQALTDVESSACAGFCTAQGGKPVGSEPVDRWLAERNHVPHFNMFIERGIVLDTIEVAATWDRIDDLYREVIAALQQVPGIMVASGHSSHSYAQGTNIYFTFVARPDDRDKEESTYLECWGQAMEATLRCGGTIAHHHGIGRLRLPWMARELGEGAALLRALKQVIDPNGIMNPGVLIPE
jgi:alkyldihydroxyacetonephosphate synthase